MSNLYYGYRGDNAAQRPPASATSSQQQHHLTPTKDSASVLSHSQGLSAFSVSAQQPGHSLRPSASQPVSQPTTLGFPPQQAWAPDQTSPQQQTSHSQTNQLHPSIVNTAFQGSQPLRTATHTMNGTRTAPVGSRPNTGYEDSLFQMMGKGFGDNNARTGAPVTSANLPHAQQSSMDEFSQLRPTGSSAVFDPSEFPSLGGALGGPGGLTVSAATLLSTSSSLDTSAMNAVAMPGSSMNGLGQYADLYNMGGYGDGRAKAVDALTGASAASEFSMQSEDFPALGGAPAPGGMRSSSVIGTATNGSAGAPGVGIAPGAQIDKLGVSETYYEQNAAAGAQSQLHASLGRGAVRPDAPSTGFLMGRAGPTSNGYQISEGLTNSPLQRADRNGNQPLAAQPRSQQQDTSVSPTKSLFHVTPQSHDVAAQNVSLPQDSSTSRGGADDFDILGGSDSRTRQNAVALETSAPVVGDGLGMRTITSNGPTGAPDASSSLLTRLAATSLEDGNESSSTSVLPADQYGMKGLLPVVSPGADGSNMNFLSIGVDLTALGLNLNSAEPLHKTFENPWEGGQGSGSGLGDGLSSSTRNEEPEYKLPTCYYMQPPALKTSHFTKFQLETLFYVFYNMPRDVLQLLAAVELYSREWRYHKDLKLWFTRAPGTTQGYERGAYIYFDIKSWERRPFHDANQSFIQGLMTEDELRASQIPAHMSSQ